MSGADQTDALRKARDLYAGDLLPGFYEDWILEGLLELKELYESLKDVEAPPDTGAHAELGVKKTNIPRNSNLFVGREKELAYLLESPQPLLTVLGPGGVGKTRLALELGRRILKNGGEAWFVSFAGPRRTSTSKKSSAANWGFRSKRTPPFWIRSKDILLPGSLS